MILDHRDVGRWFVTCEGEVVQVLAQRLRPAAWHYYECSDALSRDLYGEATGAFPAAWHYHERSDALSRHDFVERLPDGWPEQTP